MKNNRLSRFHAWLPRFLTRHQIVVDTDGFDSDNSNELLDRMAKFRPLRAWTIDHDEAKIVFRFRHADDMVMFQMLVL